MARVDIPIQDGEQKKPTPESEVFSEEQKLESLLDSSRKVKYVIDENTKIITKQEEQISTLTTTIKELEIVENNVYNNIKDGKEILFNLDNEIKSREINLNDLKKIAGDTIQQISEASKKIDSINEAKAKELDNAIQKKEIILKQKEDSIIDIENKHKSLLNENDSLMNKNIDLSTKNSLLSSDIDTKTQELFLIESKLEEKYKMSTDIEGLKDTRNSLKKEIEDLEIKKNIYVSEMEAKRVEIETKVRESENVIKIAEGKADYLNRLIDKVEAEKIINSKK